MQSDEFYMSRCIQLALLGSGYVAPNPMVGCVIVHKDKIIAEGFHQKYGESHAEVNAINSVEDKSILPKCTIYVSLEPCSHHGKTPPCADLIIEHRFKRAVIGSLDPHAKVAGKGLAKLRKAGIEVKKDVLKEQCEDLNKMFFTYHLKKRPYILLKWAQTEDDFIDNMGVEAQISSEETRPFVHQWRAQYQSILVGRKTVMNDNPSLTVRAVEGRNPIRIILDPLNRLEKNYNVFNNEAETVVLNLEKNLVNNNVRHIKLNTVNAVSIAEALYDLEIISVLVEGGAQTIQTFIDSGYWDEAKVIVGSVQFEGGTLAPVMNALPTDMESNYSDKIYTFYNQ